MALFGGKGKARTAGGRRQVRERSGVAGRVALVAFALLLAAVPVPFVNNAMGYVPLISLLVLIGVSYAYLRVLGNALEFSEDSMLTSCERGREIEFEVTFKNKSPLVFVSLEAHFYMSDLFGEVSADLPSTMTLMPFEERLVGFNAEFDHIGTYSAGLSKVVISDLLGLFRRTVVNESRHSVTVLPRLFDIERLDLSNLSVQESRKAFQPIVTDDMDYAGVRDYEPGDPLKTIHWKLSARSTSGTYFTRLFETFGNPGIQIILDSTSPEYDHESLMQVFDGIVESALSINEYAREHGIDSEIDYLDRTAEAESAHVLGVEDSPLLIDRIPRIEPRAGDEALRLLRRCVNSNHGQGNIAYVTAHVNSDIVTVLLEARLQKRNPILFVVVPRALEGAERRAFLAPLRRLEAAQVAYYVVSGADEISGGEAR